MPISSALGDLVTQIVLSVLTIWVIVTDATASVTITQVAQKLHRASLYML